MSSEHTCSVFGNAKCHPERIHEEHQKEKPPREEKESKHRSAFGNAEVQLHRGKEQEEKKHKSEKPKHESKSKICSPFGNAACARSQREKK